MSSFQLFEPSSFDAVEDLEQYTTGGLCPIDLGRKLHDDQYEIIHKLGYGGFSTVWLAQDSRHHRYVALKIMRADSSDDCNELKVTSFLRDYAAKLNTEDTATCLLLPMDSFYVESLNGKHLCLVYKVAGPPISKYAKSLPTKRLSTRAARDFSYQAAKSLGYLHASGVGHGDITPMNLLLQLKNLDNISKDNVLDMFGKVYQEKLYRRTANSNEPSQGPEYVVEPAAASKISEDLMMLKLYIIDFGEAFQLASPPPRGLGTPYSYLAPEVIFEKAAGSASDVWALACTIFEVRAGQPLFTSFIGSEDEILAIIVEILGKLPERWWNRWQARDQYFDRDGEGLEDEDGEDPVLLEGLKAIGNPQGGGLGDGFAEPLSEIEAGSLYDLLSKMLKYEPTERISVEEALKHPWFTGTAEDKESLSRKSVNDDV